MNYKSSFFLLFVMLLFSCKKGKTEDFLTVESTRLVFSASANVSSIPCSSNADIEAVSSQSEWCTATVVKKGTAILVSVSKNNSSDQERTATIIVTAGMADAVQIDVKQQSPSLKPSEPVFNVNADAEQRFEYRNAQRWLSMQTNLPVTIASSEPSWCTAEYKQDYLVISVTTNDDLWDERTAEVTIAASGFDEVKIKIIQNSIITNKSDDFPFLLFQTGFEGTSRVFDWSYFKGKDETLEKSDFETDVIPWGGELRIQSAPHKIGQQFAEVIPEPENPDNHVLRFQANGYDEITVPLRIQVNAYEIKKGLKEFNQSVRMFLPEHMNELKWYPTRWAMFTILEIWNNYDWTGSPYAFRISFNIYSYAYQGDNNLYFNISAEDSNPGVFGWQGVWSAGNRDIVVPVGEWFTMHYYFKEGDAANGRMVIQIETAEHGKQTLFDITNFTHSPRDPAPDGVTGFNPLKIYSDNRLIDFLKNRGKPSVDIYWDDFKLYGK